MLKKYTCALLLTFLSLFSQAKESNTVFEWPDKYQAGVSLSYDDALFSQLNNAIPALDKYGFKGAFYLTLSSPATTKAIEQWRAAAKNGHELGNHTVYHPCSKTPKGRDWVKPYHNTDIKTLAQMQQEVTVANAFLQAIDGKTSRTFTPPCGDFKVTDGNYVEAIRDQFIAIKGYNPQYDKKFDLLLMPHKVDGKTLIDFVEKAKAQGGIANILFHGIGGDHLSVSNEAHNQLLEYLAKHKETLWVDTYLNLMSYVKHNAPTVKR